jgi:hypothetical protein
MRVVCMYILQASKTFYEVERRHNYTTPKVILACLVGCE